MVLAMHEAVLVDTRRLGEIFDELGETAAQNIICAALEQLAAALADTREAAMAGDTARLAERAHGMGMVPATSTAYIRLSDHSVVGVAKASTDDRRFSVVTKPGSSSPDAR